MSKVTVRIRIGDLDELHGILNSLDRHDVTSISYEKTSTPSEFSPLTESDFGLGGD